MNEDLKEHINESLKQGIRLDGREKEEFRKIEFKTGVIKTAEGSAWVKCGTSEIIAGVKIGVGNPFPDKPDDGVLMVGAELLPLSNPEFESGPPSNESIEVARVIDRAIRESQVIDTKSLCIESGEKVWMISVDICPLNTDGNLIDLGSLAAALALKSATFPSYKDGKVDYKSRTEEKLPLGELPLTVTVVKIGENYLVDPTESEVRALDARLSIGVMSDGRLCSMQKGGEAAITAEDVDNMIDLARSKAEELRKIIS